LQPEIESNEYSSTRDSPSYEWHAAFFAVVAV